jgi:hypothetical protein
MPDPTDFVPQFRRFSDEDISTVSKLLAYGTWSGPGYTAGHFGLSIALFLKDETRTAHYRRFKGVDAYDHFVARPHDLNEMDAESVLIQSLLDLGIIEETPRELPFLDVNNVEVKADFDVPDELVRGGKFGGRFVNVDHYLGKAATRDRSRVAEALARYAVHVAYSNIQYSIDVIANRVDTKQPKSTLMNVQIQGSSPLFLKEAKVLLGAPAHLSSKVADEFDTNQIIADIRDNWMIGPQSQDPHLITAGNGDRYAPTFLSTDNLFSMSFEAIETFRWGLLKEHTIVVSDAHLQAMLKRLRAEQAELDENTRDADIPG